MLYIGKSDSLQIKTYAGPVEQEQVKLLSRLAPVSFFDSRPESGSTGRGNEEFSARRQYPVNLIQRVRQIR